MKDIWIIWLQLILITAFLLNWLLFSLLIKHILIIFTPYVKNRLSSLIDILFSAFSALDKILNFSSNINKSLFFAVKINLLEGKRDIFFTDIISFGKSKEYFKFNFSLVKDIWEELLFFLD